VIALIKIINRCIPFIVILVLILFTPRAFSLTADPEAGKDKATPCSMCHGEDGNSIEPEWPNLASQNKQYIINSIKAFQSGARGNCYSCHGQDDNDVELGWSSTTGQHIVAVMKTQLMTLTNQDIENIAAYYNNQSTTALETDSTLANQGESLYTTGNKLTGVSACIGCHGPTGRANGDLGYPSLAGQHALYTENTLRNYASGERQTEANNLMKTLSSSLSETEIRAVSAYIQALGSQ